MKESEEEKQSQTSLSSCCGEINSLAHPDTVPEPISQRKSVSLNLPSVLLP